MRGQEPGTYERRRSACVALRRQLAVSQAALADSLGITRERLNRFENSKITVTEAELVRIERILAQFRDQRVAELEAAC